MAIRTISVIGGNWNSTGTWDEGVVPVAGDTVVVRASGDSGNVTVTAAAAAASVNLTAGAYNGTFTINNTITLTLTAGLTLNSSGTCTGIDKVGTGAIAFTASQTVTTNGKTLACNITCTATAGAVITLGDNVNHTGLLTVGNATATQFSGSFTWTTSGGMTMATKHIINSGCKIKLTGGTYTGSATTANNLTGAGTIEIDGNITIATALNVGAITVLYTSGNIGGTVGPYLSGATCTINGGGTWAAMSVVANCTLTLGADIIITGIITLANNISLTMAGAKTVTCGTLTGGGGTNTLTRDATWNITTLQAVSSSASTLSILGAFDLSVQNCYFTSGNTLNFVSGRTLTVTAFYVVCGTGGISSNPIVKANTASSSFTLDIQTTAITSFSATYTDVNVTTNTLYNYRGGVLTRTSNITNFATTPADSTDPGIANVRLNTSYKINGSSLSGTNQSPRSFGSIG